MCYNYLRNPIIEAVKEMKCVVYEFDRIHMEKKNDYIFQIIKNRKGTEIYHAHNFYEIVLFICGSGEKVVNEQSYIMEQGSVMIFRPGDRHCFSTQTEDAVILSLSVRTDEFERFAALYDAELISSIRKDDRPPAFTLREIFPYAKSAADETVMLDDEYNCKFLLSFFLKSYLDSVHGDGDVPCALARASAEMRKPLNLRDGADAFTSLSGYSRSHLARLVNKYFGMSLNEYINELRMHRAYGDIMFTSKRIEDIAYDVGFSSVSHFNKLIKQRFNATPAALRKRGGIVQ